MKDPKHVGRGPVHDRLFGRVGWCSIGIVQPEGFQKDVHVKGGLEMKWFIPHAKDEDEVYESIKKHLARVLNIASFADRRIRKITYYHNRRTHEAEVGKRLPLIGEEVFAILYEPGRDLYHVCTPNRGVLRDMSVLVGASEVTCVEDFDTE